MVLFMSVPIKITKENIRSIRLVSYSEVLKYLKEYSESTSSGAGTSSLLINRVLEYVYKFHKVPYEKVDELRSKLSNYGLNEEVVVLIINICPKTVDELRTLLVHEEKTYETSFLENIINILRDYCTEE